MQLNLCKKEDKKKFFFFMMTKIYIYDYMIRYNTCIQMHQRVCNFYTTCMHMYIYIYESIQSCRERIKKQTKNGWKNM